MKLTNFTNSLSISDGMDNPIILCQLVLTKVQISPLGYVIICITICVLTKPTIFEDVLCDLL